MQATQSEHAVTRGKMNAVMAKIRKGKNFQSSYCPQPSSRQLSGNTSDKLLIMQDKICSHLRNFEARKKHVTRRLVFGDEVKSQSRGGLWSERAKKRITSCSLSNFDPNIEANINRKSCLRVSYLT